MARVFICYRREDSDGWARLLHDRLVSKFGESEVFMDVDAIRAGLDFYDVLEKAVAACSVLIAVIGRNWLQIKGEDGKSRIMNDSDFVRIEISAALRKGIYVIPVLVGGGKMPKPAELPPDLSSFARRQAQELPDTGFNYAVAKLVMVIEATEAEQGQARKAEEQRKTEEARLAGQAEEQRKAEEARLASEAEEQRKVEEARLVGEAEEQRKAEEARLVSEAEEQRKAEEARLAGEAEEQRKAEEARLVSEAEEQRKAEEARLASEAEEQRKAEEARLAGEVQNQRRTEKTRRAHEVKSQSKVTEERRALKAQFQREVEREQRLTRERVAQLRGEEDLGSALEAVGELEEAHVSKAEALIHAETDRPTPEHQTKYTAEESDSGTQADTPLQETIQSPTPEEGPIGNAAPQIKGVPRIPSASSGRKLKLFGALTLLVIAVAAIGYQTLAPPPPRATTRAKSSSGNCAITSSVLQEGIYLTIPGIDDERGMLACAELSDVGLTLLLRNSPGRGFLALLGPLKESDVLQNIRRMNEAGYGVVGRRIGADPRADKPFESDRSPVLQELGNLDSSTSSKLSSTDEVLLGRISEKKEDLRGALEHYRYAYSLIPTVPAYASAHADEAFERVSRKLVNEVMSQVAHPGPVPDEPHLSISADGKTIADSRSGLTWTRFEFRTTKGRYPQDWKEATTWTEETNAQGYAGFKDWAVPTITNYRTINKSNHDRMIYFATFVDPGAYGFWTKSKTNKGLASWISFINGSSASSQTKNDKPYFLKSIRLVRKSTK